MTRQRPTTAVVGSGVAGLTAAYVLRQRDEVVLYEAQDRLGGHAHTHELVGDHGRTHRVDTGFLVHNRRTYPLLTRLFDELAVRTAESEMSMSVRCEGCGLEYAGAKGPRGLLARPRHARRGAYLRMLGEVPLFHRRARALLAAGEPEGDEEAVTLREFLVRGRFSPYFVRHFAVPLVSCVWSCPPETAARYPARYLFRFLAQHGMLSVTGSPKWRTVQGGSQRYVERIARRLPTVHTGTPVRAVRRHADGADVVTADGTVHRFDAVVLAVHADQALRLLAEPTAQERRVLGAFRYSRNPAVLHTDPALLPRSRAAAASWNYVLPRCRTHTDEVRVSYDLNRLHRLDAGERYVLTLGGDEGVHPEAVRARMVYEHPVYTPESVAAQAELPQLDGGHVVFAGAYHGWGFHEDGCRSGVGAARALGVRW